MSTCHLVQYVPHHVNRLATSVDVERLFSKGRLLLSCVRNRMSAQTTRALLCLGSWSLAGLVEDEDVVAETLKADIAKGEDEPSLEDGWDSIKFSFNK
ncbi:hypothetical protein B0H14DRAFT_2343748 [Mycena olivaceomarginata]|nr:hypothetical protein B0H14DRAFT_2343748 [Mycena olivaceomarginata]